MPSAATASGWDLLGHAGQPGGRNGWTPTSARECGNLLWALHNVDLEYRYWQDTELRDNVLYPLLLRAVNYYRHFLVEKGDGCCTCPSTYSPEYTHRRGLQLRYRSPALGLSGACSNWPQEQGTHRRRRAADHRVDRHPGPSSCPPTSIRNRPHDRAQTSR